MPATPPPPRTGVPRAVGVVGALLGLAVCLACALLAADGVQVSYQLPPVDGVPQARTAVHEPALVATVVAALSALGPLALLVGTLLRPSRRVLLALTVLAGGTVAAAVVAVAVAGSIPPPTF